MRWTPTTATSGEHGSGRGGRAARLRVAQIERRRAQAGARLPASPPARFAVHACQLSVTQCVPAPVCIPATPTPTRAPVRTPAGSHLNGASLEAVATRPALLVCDAAAAAVAPVERARRERALLDALLAALRGGGRALLPVDSAGRVLELLLLLDAHWEANTCAQRRGTAVDTDAARARGVLAPPRAPPACMPARAASAGGGESDSGGESEGGGESKAPCDAPCHGRLHPLTPRSQAARHLPPRVPVHGGPQHPGLCRGVARVDG